MTLGFDGANHERRHAVKMLLLGWGFLSVLPLVRACVEYLSPLAVPPSDRVSVKIDMSDPLAPDSARIVRFQSDPVIIVRNNVGQYRAFSARCTHLGCIVAYAPDGGSGHFSCNCHGSQFDGMGKNIAGPAPKPLTQLKVVQDGTTIELIKI